MAEQPGKVKLADAVDPEVTPRDEGAETAEGRPNDTREPQDSRVDLHNARVQPTREDRLVEVGRADQTAGRQSPGRHEKHGD